MNKTSAEYWAGHEDAVRGVAMRWEEALTAPMPAPGVMVEPLESLYRRTEALRQAIAEAEKQKPVAWIEGCEPEGSEPILTWDKTESGAIPLYLSPPPVAEKQEPVAWLHKQGNFTEACMNALHDDEIDRGWTQEPLYTSPPPVAEPHKRQWVGLTDEEMLSVVHYTQLDNARAIEAKLKEKNT